MTGSAQVETVPRSVRHIRKGRTSGKAIYRVAYLATHPIQYQAPLLRQVAAQPDIELKVFFSSDFSVKRFVEPDFNRAIEWDVNLLEGYDYKFLPSIGRKDYVSFWRPFNFSLGGELRAGQFDALWVHGYMRLHHWIAIGLAKGLGTRVFLSYEATDISCARSKSKTLAKLALFSWLRRATDCFLAIGSLNHSYYHNLGVDDERIVLMPYAVDNLFFQTRLADCARGRERLRRCLRLDMQRPILLFVGKLISRKRPEHLLEAYVGLSPDGHKEPEPYLVYVGDGPVADRLRQRAASLGWNSVRILGFKNQTELPALYDLCDALVMPSEYETWGLVVNEIMNAGKPVIVSNRVGCAPDLVQNNVNGFIYNYGDVNDLVGVLKNALGNSARLREMGHKSLEIIAGWNFDEDLRGLRKALQAAPPRRDLVQTGC